MRRSRQLVMFRETIILTRFVRHDKVHGFPSLDLKTQDSFSNRLSVCL